MSKSESATIVGRVIASLLSLTQFTEALPGSLHRSCFTQLVDAGAGSTKITVAGTIDFSLKPGSYFVIPEDNEEVFWSGLSHRRCFDYLIHRW